MSIQKEVFLRYRSEGHVRFELPARLCQDFVAKKLTSEMSRIDGVYHINLNRRQKKISIRYQESFCNFQELASQLSNLIVELDQQGYLAASTMDEIHPGPTAGERLRNTRIAKWLDEKYIEARETYQAARIVSKRSVKKSSTLIKDPEKAIINFLNDILVLFLIKMHWQRITQQWIPHPIRYRYEWIAVFYLTYLLMRSRKPK